MWIVSTPVLLTQWSLADSLQPHLPNRSADIKNNRRYGAGPLPSRNVSAFLERGKRDFSRASIRLGSKWVFTISLLR